MQKKKISIFFSQCGSWVERDRPVSLADDLNSTLYTWEGVREVTATAGSEPATSSAQVASEWDSELPVGPQFWMCIFYLKCLYQIPNVLGLVGEMN